MQHRLFQLFIAVVLVIASAAATSPPVARAAAGPQCYVDIDATGGGNDGNSWGSAYTSLQTALADTNCTVIWVANGEYTPGPLRNDTFWIRPGTTLLGGFAGGETSVDERDWLSNFTALSGEIGNPFDLADNSYTIVTMIATAATPITDTTSLDGFGILWGYGDSTVGGGLYCDGYGPLNECSPELSHIIFAANHAGWGGAMYLSGGNEGDSSPTLTDVTFDGNSAVYDGGALYADGENGTSSPALTKVTFSDNSAGGWGGAMVSWGAATGTSSPMLGNVTFHNNDAGSLGGAMANYGYGGTSSPVLANVTFSGNTADNGGALYNSGGSGGVSSPVLTNVILWGDSAVTSGDEIYNVLSTPSISYSVVEGGCGSTGASCGSGNLDTDPVLGPLADNGGDTKTMALLAGSSAIDAGDWTACGSDQVDLYDARGVGRFFGPECDIGAYERVPAPADFDGYYLSNIVVYHGGAWLFYDFVTGGYADGWWTGDPGGCIPAPMDYDNDARKEFTQLCGNAWHFYNDDGSYNKGIWIGLPGALPVPADYSGDTRDDVVVFDGGAWQHFNFDTGLYDAASSVWTGFPGGAGTPAAMDYDGDGGAEPTILDSTGAWHFYNDNGSYNKGVWAGGIAGDIPVPGDYNGDGTDQPVVFSGGAWQFFDFATGLYDGASSVWTGVPAPSGSGTVGPAPLDYDGDGILDFTYYAGGAWHFYNANGGYNKGIWTGGTAGDVPISRRQLP